MKTNIDKLIEENRKLREENCEIRELLKESVILAEQQLFKDQKLKEYINLIEENQLPIFQLISKTLRNIITDEGKK